MTSLEKAMENLALAMESLARSREENDRAREASEERLRLSLAESRRETERVIAESRREMDASRRESEASRRETDARIAAAVEAMNALDGKWGNRIGDLTEKVLVPGIRRVMERFGHDFTRMAPKEEFYSRGGTSGQTLTEVDLFLENPEEAMAVEVKTRMCEDNVTKHLKRLKLLREYEEVLGLTGKTLYGAMAGLVIDEAARKLALDSGLYIVEMVEDSKHVNVVEPPAGVRGW